MTRREKILLASSALNRQRYEMGMGGGVKKWVSCAKGDVLAAGLYPRNSGERPPAYNYIDVDDKTPLEELRLKALMAHCECHPNLSMSDLMEMMYPTSKPPNKACSGRVGSLARSQVFLP